MRFEFLYPTNYLKCVDFRGKDVTMTIKKVQSEEIQGHGGKIKKKAVLYFNETEKMIILNKTNGKEIAKSLSKETDIWIGKRITFFPTKTKFGKEMVDCIRVRNSPDKLEDSEISEINDRIHKG